MPPVAAAGVGVAAAVGATGVAATVVATAVSGAITGAIVGFATAAISGGDPLQGALKGAGFGAIGGAAMGAAGIGVAATGVAPTTAGVTGTTAGTSAAINPMTPGIFNVGQVTAANAGAGAALPAAGAALAATPPPSPTATSLFGGHGAEILGNSVAGAGKALLEKQTAGKEIDALMERDRLNRDAVKIKGLSQTTSPTLPKIDKFAAKPDWQNLFA